MLKCNKNCKSKCNNFKNNKSVCNRWDNKDIIKCKTVTKTNNKEITTKKFTLKWTALKKWKTAEWIEKTTFTAKSKQGKIRSIQSSLLLI